MCVAINKAAGIDESLLPKKPEERKLNPWNYMSMWLGDGVNLGNMTLGGSLVVAGTAMMNIYQTLAAAFIAIAIISVIFSLNDSFGYKTGIPYVMQLRMSFGAKGSIISSLLRGIPAIVWYASCADCPLFLWFQGHQMGRIDYLGCHHAGTALCLLYPSFSA